MQDKRFYYISEDQYDFDHPEYGKLVVTAEDWLNYIKHDDYSFVPITFTDRDDYALRLWRILGTSLGGSVFVRDHDNRIDWRIETSVYLDGKEDNEMTENKNYPEFVTEVDAIHNLSITEIQAELEKDISNAKRKAAAATELENEQYEKVKIQKEYEMMAYKQRTYYDELVKAGFTEEQAWEMVRMPFGIPYTPSYAV